MNAFIADRNRFSVKLLFKSVDIFFYKNTKVGKYKGRLIRLENESK